MMKKLYAVLLIGGLFAMGLLVRAGGPGGNGLADGSGMGNGVRVAEAGDGKGNGSLIAEGGQWSGTLKK